MSCSKLEVNVLEFQNNIRKIKEYAGKEVMPIIKANAYGTYLNKRIDVLEMFPIVAVAEVDEGVTLRENGYKNEIFVLNQPSMSDIDNIVKNKLTIGISSINFLEECIKKKAKFNVHLEIETGMNRTGIQLDNLFAFIDKIKNSNLKVEGIYTHFSSADYDPEYTNFQINNFKEALALCKDNGLEFKYIHMSASNGILKYDLDFTNLVRPGIIIYGYDSYPGSCEVLDLKPICKLKSEVTFLKTVKAGAKIGYSQSYTCDIDSVIATIPIGYADGYRRSLSNKGYVYINGKKAPIVGNICMDGLMVDVTGIRVEVGDEVIIFDNEHITIDELSKLCNTINYEFLCTIGDRITRVFIEE